MSELQIDFKDQINQFLLSVLLGFALALLYDLFKSIRLSFLKSKFAVFVFDIAYFIISALFTYVFLLAYCKGEFRFYVITGAGAGCVFYRILISKYVLAVFKFILNIFAKIISCFLKITARCTKLLKIGVDKAHNKAKKYLKCLYNSLYNLRNCKRKEGVKNGQAEREHFA